MKEIKGTIASPKGFLADAVHAQLKYKNLDLTDYSAQYPQVRIDILAGHAVTP